MDKNAFILLCSLCLFYLRLKNSNQLETSLNNGKTFLSSYENKLAREEVAPADISSLEKTQRELAVSTKSLWQILHTQSATYLLVTVGFFFFQK